MHQSSKNRFLQTTLAGVVMDRRCTRFLGQRVLNVLDNLIIELLKLTRFLGERVLAGYIFQTPVSTRK